jgi:solute carrier family 66 (lysosomal lysine-arginine transporter), member 1
VLCESSDSSVPRPSSPNRVHFVAPTSVDPTHLLLNLRILAFIEACRTIPLEYKPPRTSREGTDYLSVTTMDEVDSSSSVPANLRHEDPDLYEQHLNDLLCRLRKLYVFANSLKKANDRSTYLEELGQVGGLLAYKIPETSPTAKYLSQARREAVADQINSAVLCEFVPLLARSSQPTPPYRSDWTSCYIQAGAAHAIRDDIMVLDARYEIRASTAK